MKVADRPGAVAVITGFVLAMTALPAGAQQTACEADASPELAGCSASAADGVRERIGAADAHDRARDQFREADTDASGTISPEEWRSWREQRSTGASGDVGLRLAPGQGAWSLQAGGLW